jgi:hypothetical protein
LSGSQIAHYINYYTAQIDLLDGRRGFDYPEMIVIGANLETARGLVMGETGLKGVAVLRSDDTPHPDFARMQSDDGTYYVAPEVAVLSAPNILSGSKVFPFIFWVRMP